MATHSTGVFTLPMFSFVGSDSKVGEFTIPMFTMSGACGSGGGPFEIPMFSFTGEIVTRGLRGTFILPVPIMAGTTKANMLSSGIFRLPQFIFQGGFTNRLSGTFTLPMFIFSSLAPGHSAGSFTLPMFSMYGFGRESPISKLYRAIVMNINNQAISTYSGFNFKCLASFNNSYYGISDQGICKLGGNKDSISKNINARMKTSSMNLGDDFIKYIRDAWVTFRSDGHLQVTFSTDEDEGITSVSQTEVVSEKIMEEKLKCGRGLRGRFHTVLVENVSGSDFDIEQLSILVDAIKRKVR